jgi:putative transposase
MELACRHPPYGYWRLHQMLVREQPGRAGQGEKINVKRVRSLCVALRLKLPAKGRRKGRGIGLGMPVRADHPNHVWAYDFVYDWCDNGRQLKMLTVVDEFTRGCLKIEVEHQMGAKGVCDVLTKLMAVRSEPAFVRSDNGLEFIAKAAWRCVPAY